MIKYVSKTWLRFAHLLSGINSRILLTLLFFLAILPVGIAFRIFGKGLFRACTEESLWLPRPEGTGAERPF